MSRVENIAKFAQKRNEEQIAKEIATMKRIEEYKETIKSLKPRIDELIIVGNACMKNDIPLTGKAWGGHEGYDTHQFFTNCWSHLLGFVAVFDQNTRKQLPITKLGIYGGGCCDYNLVTDGETIEIVGKDVAFVLKRFVDEFDKFETEFYKYVDKVTA